MRLVVDTSVLVGELLRATGRARLADERLELFLPEQMWQELRHELPRRIGAFVRRRGLPVETGEQLARLGIAAVEANVGVVDEAVYGALEADARWRSVRDPADWPLVACALALDAGVWSADHDLFGTGVPTWSTETVQAWLERTDDSPILVTASCPAGIGLQAKSQASSSAIERRRRPKDVGTAPLVRPPTT